MLVCIEFLGAGGFLEDLIKIDLQVMVKFLEEIFEEEGKQLASSSVPIRRSGTVNKDKGAIDLQF
jgi:hypothetical protein